MKYKKHPLISIALRTFPEDKRKGVFIFMCGIVGFTGTEKAAPILIDGLSKLEYRGYDSAGIAVLKEEITVERTVGRVKELADKSDSGEKIDGTTGIGHTRWATHGAPSVTNAHPHRSSDGRIAVVHNGIIENYTELRAELISKGLNFVSETDTEVIPKLIEYYYNECKNPVKAVRKTLKRLCGSFALGMIFADMPDTIIAAKKESPLIIGVGDNGNFIASDVTATVAYTKKVIYLDDGDMAVISKKSISVTDFDGNPVHRPLSVIDWDISVAEKGGYDHFMMKEMMEQPAVNETTIRRSIKGDRIVFDGMKLPVERIRAFDRILITACGSAAYAGHAAKYALEKLTGIPTTVELASELRYNEPIINEKTLLIVISQSGETADTIAALKECRSMGAYTVAVVNVVGSTIAKLADDRLYTSAGPEIAVATTKGYTTQLSVLYMLALYLGDKLGTVSEAEYSRLVTELKALPEKMKEAIELNKNLPELAKKYHACSSLFFMGRNIDSAVAMEGSLKLKEISYLHSESYPAGELKHGTISLIENGHLVIALACCERLFEKTLSNIKEVKSRGATVLGVTLKGNDGLKCVADDVILVPKAEPLFSASVEVLPLQLYAYYVARENGCDIDKPRNLAKSVTVE